MAARGPYRRYNLQFKIQICNDVRSGKLARRETLKTNNLSANLMSMRLGQFDRRELDREDAAASMPPHQRLQSMKCTSPLWSERSGSYDGTQSDQQFRYIP